VTYPIVALPDPAAQTLGLSTTNWSGNLDATPGWYEDLTGVVHLEGEADQGTTGDLEVAGSCGLG
jgi:hypothetical protein